MTGLHSILENFQWVKMRQWSNHGKNGCCPMSNGDDPCPLPKFSHWGPISHGSCVTNNCLGIYMCTHWFFLEGSGLSGHLGAHCCPIATPSICLRITLKLSIYLLLMH